jgi:hypothetical protein
LAHFLLSNTQTTTKASSLLLLNLHQKSINIYRKEREMIRPVGLILAIIVLLTCSGCFWGVEHDREGHGDRDRGGHEMERHDDRGGHDEHH